MLDIITQKYIEGQLCLLYMTSNKAQFGKLLNCEDVPSMQLCPFFSRQTQCDIVTGVGLELQTPRSKSSLTIWKYTVVMKIQ